MIDLQNITHRYSDSAVLEDISLTILPQQFVFLTGASGAGKSTLLSLMAGIEKPTKGIIAIDGQHLDEIGDDHFQQYRRHCGFLFQDFKLLHDRTIEENVAFPLEVLGVHPKKMEVQARNALQRTDTLGIAARYPDEVSMGERARAALARAIVHHPLILFADEPTGNLDPKQSMEMLELLRSIHEEDKTTMIIATHDRDIVDEANTRVITMEKGRIKRDSVGAYEERDVEMVELTKD